MSDLVERLHDYASGDHARGCAGRFYSCECGYNDRRDPLLVEAADEIERLQAALQDMIEISQRNSEAGLMLIAIRKCAAHALEGK